MTEKLCAYERFNVMQSWKFGKKNFVTKHTHIHELIGNLQNVYGLGGRYFWIHNTGPIGCLPYAMVHRPDLAVVKDGSGCSVAYTEVAQLFNQRLKEPVGHLRKTHADAAFTYVDVYSAKYKLISDAKKLGKA